MASEMIEDEVAEIFDAIQSKRHFVLTGGAGSGKTYSLVSVINEIYRKNPLSRIACITYTNAAVQTFVPDEGTCKIPPGYAGDTGLRGTPEARIPL